MIDFSVLTPQVVYEFFLRWIHFLSGITWVGFLYWFNFVNVNFQKALDAELKPKVNPILIPSTLWYFRWGAVVTVLSGFLYYVNILHGEPVSGVMKPLVSWLVLLAISYAIMFKVIRPEGALNNGKVLGAVVSAIVVALIVLVFVIFQALDVRNNSTYAIGIGGGLGIFMLLNVWGIIWPAQKRILGLVPLEPGADKTKLARRVFLASRTNAFLSIPMLFFMAVSSHLNLVQWY